MKDVTERALMSLRVELDRAFDRYGSFHSAHEGWAVIREEVDELWDEVKKKSDIRTSRSMREEAIQIAAMAIRFAVDICPEEL